MLLRWQLCIENRWQQDLVGDWLTVKDFGLTCFWGCCAQPLTIIRWLFQLFSWLTVAPCGPAVVCSSSRAFVRGFYSTLRGSKYPCNASWS